MGLPTPCVQIPDTSITVGFEQLTPADAQKHLSLNGHNRGVAPRVLNAYIRDMEEGRWKPGSTIEFDAEGHLLNGQHRLHAVIKTGRPQWFTVLRGLPVEAQDTMDTGKKRTLGDQLKIRGEKNYFALAAATRAVWNYTTLGTLISSGVNLTPSTGELLATLEEHPLLRNHVTSGGPTVGMPGKLYSGFKYLAWLADPEDADTFTNLLHGGEGLTSGDPIHTLRERLISEAAKTSTSLTSISKAVFLIRTWNAWRRGEVVTKLQFKAGGTRPDRIPLIDGCPIIPQRGA